MVRHPVGADAPTPRELPGAVDHLPCEDQLCAAACQTAHKEECLYHVHRGRMMRSRDLSCSG